MGVANCTGRGQEEQARAEKAGLDPGLAVWDSFIGEKDILAEGDKFV